MDAAFPTLFNNYEPYNYEYYNSREAEEPAPKERVGAKNADTPLNKALMLEEDGNEATYAFILTTYQQIASGRDPKDAAVANFRLGCMYWDGRGVEQDYSKVQEYFNKLDLKEFPDAIYKLGQMHFYGCGAVKQNYSQAFEHFEQAHQQAERKYQKGTLSAYAFGEMAYKLGNAYLGKSDIAPNKLVLEPADSEVFEPDDSHVFEPELLQAYKYFEMAHQQNIPGAGLQYGSVACQLGLQWLRGDNHKACSEAYSYFLVAHQQKTPGVAGVLGAAAYGVAKAYLFGNGIEKSVTKAGRWLNKAYEYGHRNYALGKLYCHGHEVVKRDIFKAVECFKVCVRDDRPKENDAEFSDKVQSALELGNIYLGKEYNSAVWSEYAGDPVSGWYDAKEALKCFEIAYDNGAGTPEAAYKLALMYQQGIARDNGDTKPLLIAARHLDQARKMIEEKGAKGHEALLTKINSLDAVINPRKRKAQEELGRARPDKSINEYVPPLNDNPDPITTGQFPFHM